MSVLVCEHLVQITDPANLEPVIVNMKMCSTLRRCHRTRTIEIRIEGEKIIHVSQNEKEFETNYEKILKAFKGDFNKNFV